MTTALARRPAPSLYQGILLAFIVLALVLQASFVAGLAAGRGGFAARTPAVPGISGTVSIPASPAVPCVNG